MNSSQYVNNERREYSLYVLQMRAIAAISDGLKAGGRRVLWTARNGQKFKSATLAGATMPIHPHASPEGAINTLAAPYGNNIPLLHGEGAFGTLLNPTAYGASRYTSVKISKFTKDVIFKDIEIVPMGENYDGTLEEPKHFLPLVPIVLLNPSEGIAVGFASTILPRDLEDIINSQVAYLSNKKFEEMMTAFMPTDNIAVDWTEDAKGNTRWIFEGAFKKINASTIQITKLPYGISHEKFTDKLLKLVEDDSTIVDFTDSSKDIFNIEVKFKRGAVDKTSKKDMLKQLNLINTVSENMNVLDFDGKRVLSTNYVEVIKLFCDWRLNFYKNRYERLAHLLHIDIQRYKDIIIAIKRNVSGTAKKIGSKSELKDFLKEIEIVHIDYITELPVYRFTEDEKNKVEDKLKAANIKMKEYKTLLSSEPERRKIYIQELRDVLRKYKKGEYNE
jgi:DNA gyrase subunit A